MKRNVFNRRIYAIFFVFAALIIGFSFIPVRVGVSYADNVDDAAMRVLKRSCEFANSHGFKTSLYGEIEARVFGIKYLQRVYGEREVGGGNYTEHAESVSTFVKAALKKSVSDGRYYVSHGKFKRGKAVYPELSELSRDDYLALYGEPPTGLIKYDIEGNIVSARRTGENEYTYVLDPQKSTVNSGIGVKTALGSKSFPEYGSVEVVLYLDGFKPVRTVCRESMRVDKFGGTACSAVYEEKFEF